MRGATTLEALHRCGDRLHDVPPGTHDDAACAHRPRCPGPDGRNRLAAATVAAHHEQGWSLLCNGVILFDDGGEIRPDGGTAPARSRPPAGRPAR